MNETEFKFDFGQRIESVMDGASGVIVGKVWLINGARSYVLKDQWQWGKTYILREDEAKLGEEKESKVKEELLKAIE